MFNKIYRNMKVLLVPGTLSILLFILITGCYQGIYTKPNPTPISEIALNSNYNFYYIGRKNAPYAIVGLDPDIKLKSKLWAQLNSAPINLDTMTLWPHDAYPDKITVKDIVNGDAEKIGIYFSYFPNPYIDYNDDLKEIKIYVFEINFHKN